MNRMKLISVIALAAVAVITVGGAIFINLMQNATPGGTTTGEASTGISFGGPFTMTDDTGQTFTEADLEGKPTVMFFGFTYCPDVCPTTLSDLSKMIDSLGTDADKLNFLFVSVDPERDTAEKVHDYLSYFDERIVGLTGTPEQVAAMTDAYGVFYEKVPSETGDYTVNHTATVYLLDANGDFTGTIDYQESRETGLAKLERLANSG